VPELILYAGDSILDSAPSVDGLAGLPGLSANVNVGGTNRDASASGGISQVSSNLTVGSNEWASDSTSRDTVPGPLLVSQTDSLRDSLLDSPFDGPFTLSPLVRDSITTLLDSDSSASWRVLLDRIPTDNVDLATVVVGDAGLGAFRFAIAARPDADDFIGHILGVTGDDASFQVAESNGESLNVESEGGEIPIGQLVGTVQPISGSAEAPPLLATGSAAAQATLDSGPDHAAPATEDISGELARAVAFEVIDGEVVPIVYAAADGSGGYSVTGRHVASTADTGHRPTIVPVAGPATAAAVEHPAARSTAGTRIAAAANRPAAVQDALHGNPGVHEQLLQLAAANLTPGRSATLGTLPADDPPLNIDGASDAARTDAFSQWGATDAERLEREDGSHAWLAAAPLLAVLAAERLVARKVKRNQGEQADRRSLK
jgi:hypothetical protein